MITGSPRITIEELPGLRLAGNWMQLNLSMEFDDLLGLWQAFSRRLGIAQSERVPLAYGICTDIQDNHDCRYWTALEIDHMGSLPTGMVPVFVPGGLYACLSVEGITPLVDCRTYLSMIWAPGQAVYDLDVDKPCFEVTYGQWDKPDTRKVCLPLKLRHQAIQPDLSPGLSVRGL